MPGSKSSFPTPALTSLKLQFQLPSCRLCCLCIIIAPKSAPYLHARIQAHPTPNTVYRINELPAETEELRTSCPTCPTATNRAHATIQSQIARKQTELKNQGRQTAYARIQTGQSGFRAAYHGLPHVAFPRFCRHYDHMVSFRHLPRFKNPRLNQPILTVRMGFRRVANK